MSYIQDDVQMIKSCIKYIDEDKLADFLNSIDFEIDNSNITSYILQTSNAKCIELCIDSFFQYNYFDDLVDTVNELIDDNTISNTTIIIIKNKLLKQTNPDIIYQILNSNLVTWYNNNDIYHPFRCGFFDGENGNISKESILNQDEVNALFRIYAESENWLKCAYVTMYAENKDALASYMEETDLSGGYYSTKKIIEDYTYDIDEEFLKDYFNENIPDIINANTFADIMIKCGIYHK